MKRPDIATITGTAVLSLLASAPAFAQTSPTPPLADTVAAPPAAALASEAIVVTGSRIARQQFATPNPIISFDAAAIQESGNTNITNFLERIPALTGSRDFTQTSGGNAVFGQPFGAAGLNELNLRGLGIPRTLVLVDGRRHVAGDVNTAAVDINSIPTDLIERVDVLTSAVSAIYGADAVTGVVNFVLKRDLDGVRARAQQGISGHGDAANSFASIAAGKNFAGGNGNITLSLEYNEDDRLENDQRSFLRFDQRQYLIPNDAAVSNPALPQNILVGQLRYPNESPIGAVSLDGGSTFTFNGLGLPYNHGKPAAYYTTGPGDDTPVAGFYSGDLAPKLRRTDVNLLSHYDVSNAFKVSVEAKYAETRATTFDYYFGTYGQSVPITNPYVSASIIAAATAAGVNSVTVNRDDLDYGKHGESDLRKTYRGVLDLSGRIGEHATYDTYAEYGETDVAITKLSEIFNSRYQQALDVVIDPATGQPACRSGFSSGCLPVNLFGRGPISGRALAYFQTNDSGTNEAITQTVGSASISGDLGRLFSLPGGPIGFSFGGEYRRETSRFNPSINFVNNSFNSNGNEPSLVVPSRGAFDVKEAFGELNAPILKDRPRAYLLSAGAAYRFSSYSTGFQTHTYQVNGVYAPVRDISFRGSYGEAVRAPNIGELFQPQAGTGTFLVDPCTPQQIGNGSSYRPANCTALLARYGTVPNNGLQTGSIISGVQEGNAGLKPETARTWTAGVVLRPRFLHGLTASFDWYDIKLRGAINTIDPSTLAALCVDGPTISNQFCANITRFNGVGTLPNFPVQPPVGTVVSYVVQPQNVASFATAGADVNVDYVLRTASAGLFDIRFVGGYVNKLTTVGLPGAPTSDNLDQPGNPEFTFNLSPTWAIGALTLGYNLRWIDAQRTQSKQTTESSPNYAPAAQLRYSELWQHDVQVALRVRGDASFYVGVLNLTDQKPDPGNAINEPISAVGRYFYTGVKANFSRR